MITPARSSRIVRCINRAVTVHHARRASCVPRRKSLFGCSQFAKNAKVTIHFATCNFLVGPLKARKPPKKWRPFKCLLGTAGGAEPGPNLTLRPDRPEGCRAARRRQPLPGSGMCAVPFSLLSARATLFSASRSTETARRALFSRREDKKSVRAALSSPNPDTCRCPRHTFKCPLHT